MFVLKEATTRGRGRIALAEVDAAVAARLGPGRVSGNAQPAAFSRQIAMYLANLVGGWSTTQIGKFYNGRDHSTVCYAIGRIRVLRETDPEVDGLLTILTNELRDRAPATSKPRTPGTVSLSRTVDPLVEEGALDALAERIATKLFLRLKASHFAATAPGSDAGEKMAEAVAVSRG